MNPREELLNAGEAAVESYDGPVSAAVLDAFLECPDALLAVMVERGALTIVRPIGANFVGWQEDAPTYFVRDHVLSLCPDQPEGPT